MSESISDILTRDREEAAARAAKREDQRAAREKALPLERVRCAVVNLKNYPGSYKATPESDWIDLLDALRQALEAAGQGTLLADLPTSGKLPGSQDARRIVLEVFRRLEAGERTQAVELLASVVPLGELDSALLDELSMRLGVDVLAAVFPSKAGTESEESHARGEPSHAHASNGATIEPAAGEPTKAALPASPSSLLQGKTADTGIGMVDDPRALSCPGCRNPHICPECRTPVPEPMSPYGGVCQGCKTMQYRCMVRYGNPIKEKSGRDSPVAREVLHCPDWYRVPAVQVRASETNREVIASTSPAAPVQEGAATPPKLTRRQRAILRVMARENVTSQTDKMTRKGIVEDLLEETWRTESWAEEFAGLGRLDLTESVPGACGGIWLTASGVEVAQALPG
jgi:hypothetical protein